MQNLPNKNLSIKCEFCNKEFHPLTPNQKYCSIFCRQNGVRQRRAKNKCTEKSNLTKCLVCGQTISRISNKKFCSEQCRRIYRNKKRNEDNLKKKLKDTGFEIKYCQYCGKLIPYNEKHKDNYKIVKFCSHKCAEEFHHSLNDNNKSFTKDGFFITTKKSEFGTYNWIAIKNEKVVLESNYYFPNVNSAYKDAKKAFVN